MLSALNRSVRYRLIAVILATTLAALLVASAALLSYEVGNYRNFLLSDVETQAEILGLNNTAPLQFDDPETARENVTALGAIRPDITAVAVYTADGAVFASYVSHASEAVPAAPRPSGRYLSGGVIELSRPIVESENGERVGTVYLRASYDLAGRVQDYLLILGAAMLLSLLVALGVSLWLQRGVTNPVRAVSAVARKVVEERDFALRAEKTTDDEIGLLVDSFNEMLAEVGRMTAALEATNLRLREETEERRSAEAALRTADRRKDEFLATLAHELRNPLAPMVNALGLIEAGKLGPEAGRARAIIDRQLEHMVRLVDDLLDVSRITRGKLAVHLSTVELASVVHSAVDTARPVIDSRRHALEVDLPEAPIYLKGDPVRLSQVFSNLLNNAAKYTEPGGRISLSAEVRDGMLETTIADTGIGMTDDMLGGVFEMFAQGAGDKTRRAQAGLGVGLALAKRLVELHGGTIEASSDGPGRGSRFTVRLPVEDGPAAVDEPEPDRGSLDSVRGGMAGATLRRRVLLVDDNVDFATSLAILLETLGHEVRVAHDAPGAVEAAAELRPEVAFLDIGLPGVSGYDIAGRLRALPACADTVMVALSGWGQAEDRERSREAGFADHLVKPVDLKTIEKVLASLAANE